MSTQTREDMVKDYLPVIYKYAGIYSKPRAGVLIDDLKQEGMLAALRCIDKKQTSSAYIATAVINSMKQYVRDHYRYTNRFITKSAEYIETLEQHKFEDIVEQEEDAKTLIKQRVNVRVAMLSLKHTDQEILRDVFFEERTGKELQAKYGLSKAGVSHRKTRALKRLEKVLTKGACNG